MPQWGDIGEQLENVEDENFDVYMLGKLLWCMVSGNRKLPRGYGRRSDYDLTKQFPNQPEIRVVNDILDKCVVKEGPPSLPQVSPELLEVVDDQISGLRKRSAAVEISRGCSFFLIMYAVEGFYEEDTLPLACKRMPHPILLRMLLYK